MQTDKHACRHADIHTHSQPAKHINISKYIASVMICTLIQTYDSVICKNQDADLAYRLKTMMTWTLKIWITMLFVCTMNHILTCFHTSAHDAGGVYHKKNILILAHIFAIMKHSITLHHHNSSSWIDLCENSTWYISESCFFITWSFAFWFQILLSSIFTVNRLTSELPNCITTHHH